MESLVLANKFKNNWPTPTKAAVTGTRISKPTREPPELKLKILKLKRLADELRISECGDDIQVDKWNN